MGTSPHHRVNEPWCALHATRASSALGYTAATAAILVLVGMAIALGVVPQQTRGAFSLTLSSIMYQGPGAAWKYVIVGLTLVSSVCTVALIGLLDRGNWVTPFLGSLATVGMLFTLGLLLRPGMVTLPESAARTWAFGDVGAGHLALVAFVTLVWPIMFFIAISRREFMRGWRAPLVLNLVFLVSIPGIVAASSLLQVFLHRRRRFWENDTKDIGVRSSLRSSAEMLYIAFLVSTLLFLAGMPRCADKADADAGARVPPQTGADAGATPDA